MSSEGHNLLAGRTVDRVAFTRGSVWLELWGKPDFTLHLEGPFDLDLLGHKERVDPGQGPHRCYLLLPGLLVERAVAFDDGALHLSFAGGGSLSVPPEQYEPWDLNAGGEVVAVSVAGGGLALWGGGAEDG